MSRTPVDRSSCQLPCLPRDRYCLSFAHIPGWPGYAVDSIGRVLSCKVERCNRYGRWHYISQQATRLGRMRVSLRDGRRRESRLVHQLVLEAFIGPRPEGMVTLHRDGDPKNNQLRNLRYGTQSENMRDAIRHGTHVFCRQRKVRQ